ncbi:MAG: hypothetical protein ACC652_03815, partial [Acidimicrobiales bacterium]
MRQIMFWAEGGCVELLDGVRVSQDDEWILTVPDPREPATHVWAEASDLEHARDALRAQVERVVAEIEGIARD